MENKDALHKESGLSDKEISEIGLNALTKQQSQDIINKARYVPTKMVNSNKEGDKKIYMFVMTGGPCAGKTTSLQYLSERFAPKFKVYVLPEMATITISAGVTIVPEKFTTESHTRFTKAIMKAQMDQEGYFHGMAQDEENDVIIICDRGMVDNFAYCSPEVKKRVLEETGWTMQQVTNKRYDAVFHLITAADGAESFYNTENNEARYETAEVARMVDKWTQNAWMEHENHFIIDNSEPGFDRKMERLYNQMCNFLQIPTGVHYTKKYLIEGEFDAPSVLPKDVSFSTFKEEFIYLQCGEPMKRTWIKKRTDPSGNISYSYIQRFMRIHEQERMELKRKITGKMFTEFQWQKDPKLGKVIKEFTVFIWNNTTYMVETYTLGEEQVNVLRISCDTESKKANICMPEFIKVGKDISEDKKYFMVEIAKLTHDMEQAEKDKAGKE